MPRIPDLPGNLVPSSSADARLLRKAVKELCHLPNNRFPGAQPVSFTTPDLEKLINEDYWVFEKSDGVRVLLFISTQGNNQDVFLLDRHNNFYRLEGLFFPHHTDPRLPLKNSLIDGELVVEVDPQTKNETLRYLCFDCLAVDDQNMMRMALDKRYGRLESWFYQPYRRTLVQFPQEGTQHPFQIIVQQKNLSYHIEKILEVDIPALGHGNDGLLYACVSTPYTPGTNRNLLKWKPQSENSVDFKLVLEFLPSTTDSPKPDPPSKPRFALHAWVGGEGSTAVYKPYDVMMETSGEKFEDRIVEVYWDSMVEGWRMKRFRDDKPTGNHIKTVESIIKSIHDSVERETLLDKCSAIRAAWKARHSGTNRRAGGGSHGGPR